MFTIFGVFAALLCWGCYVDYLLFTIYICFGSAAIIHVQNAFLYVLIL